MKLNSNIYIWIIFLPLLLQGCVPLSSSFQTAKIEKDREEFMPAVVTTYLFEEDFSGRRDNGHAQTAIGGRFASSTSEKSEFQINYARLFSDGKDTRLNVIGIGFKRSLVKDEVALVVPFGTVIGPNMGGLVISTHPSIVLSLPVGQHLEITPSFTGIVPLNRQYEKGLAVNLGARILPSSKTWDIRPEISLLRYPNERYMYLSAGIAVAIKLKSP